MPSGMTDCPVCGTALDAASTPTVTHLGPVSPRHAFGHPVSQANARSGAPPSAGSRAPSLTSLASAGAHGETDYVSGTTVAERYRIVAPLGKGGMGEVYRAEDLRLSQTVALKFLPRAMMQDEVARERFHQEVRLARQISHPNVCRVFDIGELDGRLFLTMEYVDGEDLSSLLRRIGQLPQAKGLDIARQMCAGLAAAHDHGVLHRDLKPGNIMLDGRGRVRITDFGLAAIAENLSADEVRAGTPAYMAPEQLAGTEVTARSDIYSLGLVLYEIFTGKRGFDAATVPELLELREESAPPSLSAIVRDIDPLIECVILRCLEKDPAKRPASALQVAAALPGGDPLAAALAAGETPSPEMVAAAGEQQGVRPAIAWVCMVLIVLGLAAVAFLAEKATLFNLAPLPRSPEVLAATGRDTARLLGYPAPPADTAYGFGNFVGYEDYVEKNDQSPLRWKTLASGIPPTLVFWYRESPQFMENSRFSISPTIDPDEPPNSISGMCQIFLDSSGRLLKFEAVPPQFDPSGTPPLAPNWPVLFTAAGLDMKAFHAASPQWTALMTSDTRAAWEGTWPAHPELPLRVEAAAYRGTPVFFQLISPWTHPDRMQAKPPTTADTVQNALQIVIFLAVLIFGTAFARRNVLSGRSDLRGAFFLALFAFLFGTAGGLLFAHHVPTIHEVEIFGIASAWGLISAALIWVLYIALESHVRRRWPTVLISWSRLLAGQLRDPLVGRDVLVGILAGVFWVVVGRLIQLMPGWVGKPPLPPVTALDLIQLNGLRFTLADVMLNVIIFVFSALAFFLFFFLLRLRLRNEWVAFAVMVALLASPSLLGKYALLNAVGAVLVFGVALLLLMRFGLLALVIALALNNVLQVYPLTAHLSAWYAEPTLFVFILLLALTVYSFYTAVGGRRIFGAVTLDD
jgi:Protein kinase domain